MIKILTYNIKKKLSLDICIYRNHIGYLPTPEGTPQKPLKKISRTTPSSLDTDLDD